MLLPVTARGTDSYFPPAPSLPLFLAVALPLPLSLSFSLPLSLSPLSLFSPVGMLWSNSTSLTDSCGTRRSPDVQADSHWQAGKRMCPILRLSGLAGGLDVRCGSGTGCVRGSVRCSAAPPLHLRVRVCGGRYLEGNGGWGRVSYLCVPWVCQCARLPVCQCVRVCQCVSVTPM